jgi:hypothetical protein
LAAKGIDVAPVEENTQWRIALRKMDYTRRLGVVGNEIVLNFPYSTELIDELRTFKRDSQGSGEWDKDNKQWRFALTEYNLVWLTAWAEIRDFEFDAEARRLNQLIRDCETNPYRIELQLSDTGCEITNCPDALRDYIETNLGGFELENLMRLVDNSALLGYTISTEIADLVVAGTTPRFYNLATSREVKLDPTTVTDDLASVLDYADRTERWPVVIYEPDLSGKLLAQLRSLRADVVEVSRNVKNRNWDDGFKYVHVVVPVTAKKIPLLISSAGMIYGGDKSLMVQQAEKIVYCSADVYNKAGQTKVAAIAG